MECWMPLLLICVVIVMFSRMLVLHVYVADRGQVMLLLNDADVMLNAADDAIHMLLIIC